METNTPTNNEREKKFKAQMTVDSIEYSFAPLPQTTTKDWVEDIQAITRYYGVDPEKNIKEMLTNLVADLIESTKQEERKKVQVDERMRAVEILHKYFMTTTRKESLDVIEIAQKEIMSDLSE